MKVFCDILIQLLKSTNYVNNQLSMEWFFNFVIINDILFTIINLLLTIMNNLFSLYYNFVSLISFWWLNYSLNYNELKSLNYYDVN